MSKKLTDNKNQNKNGLFIFHRDLRVEDNVGLIDMLNECINVYPVFIFTPQQVGKENKYKSSNSVRFMINTLKELSQQINMSFYYEDTTKCVEQILNDSKLNITTVGWSKDFTPFAKERDNKIKQKINKKFKNISVKEYDNITLHPLEDTLKSDGNPYLIYTPYYNNASSKQINKPLQWKQTYNKQLKTIGKNNFNSIDVDKFYDKNEIVKPILDGGRKEGLKLLDNLKNFKNYNTIRNTPSINTTRLSAHLKFGTLSVREVYYQIVKKLGYNNELIKQLHWRDFYMCVINYFPDLNKSKTKPDLNKIKWKVNKKCLDAWKNGETGFPLVDAGMREMNQTGFMHNRVRMIVATFLIYNLGLNWKDGETYFSQKLIDIDLANNLGNWKWVAGIESYSNDYFKAMAMKSQIERFDSDCEYVKEWIPELKNVPDKDIIDWEEKHETYLKDKNIDYYPPIVNSKETRKETIERYKKAIKG